MCYEKFDTVNAAFRLIEPALGCGTQAWPLYRFVRSMVLGASRNP